MSKRKGTVLIIDDEEEIRESIELLLTSEGLSTDTAGNGEEGLKKIEENLYDLVLLDLMLPGKSGMQVQREIKRIDPTLPVVIITAIGAVETAVTAIKEGSFDYVTKPWNNEKLVVIVTNGIKQRQLTSENLHLRRALKERFGYSNIVGKSEKMLKVLDLEKMPKSLQRITSRDVKTWEKMFPLLKKSGFIQHVPADIPSLFVVTK